MRISCITCALTFLAAPVGAATYDLTFHATDLTFLDNATGYDRYLFGSNQEKVNARVVLELSDYRNANFSFEIPYNGSNDSVLSGGEILLGNLDGFDFISSFSMGAGGGFSLETDSLGNILSIFLYLSQDTPDYIISNNTVSIGPAGPPVIAGDGVWDFSGPDGQIIDTTEPDDVILGAPEPSPIPLPATAPLALMGIGAIAGIARRRRK